MKYINNIGYVDESKYYKSQAQPANESGNFDSILESETTIYATPEPALSQSNAPDTLPATQPVTAPEQLDDIFKRAADQYGIDENLLKAVAKAESNFNSNSVSSAGAIGIMQLMPATASYLGVDNPYDAEANIMGGAKYLSQLLNKYNHNTSLTLAAYNAGPGNVDKYGGIPPFEETQNYVQRVLSYAGSTITSEDIIYATGSNYQNSNRQTTDHSAVTIYAMASSDATNPAKLHLQ